MSDQVQSPTTLTLEKSLNGLQSWSGRCGEDKNLTAVGNRIPAVQPVARRYTDWAILAHLTEESKVFKMWELMLWLIGYQENAPYMPTCVQMTQHYFSG
jgi:hypothetical protein